MQIRRTGLERRHEIALASLKIIGERGLTSLTTASLAEEVGVTTGALFRHFASLNDILCESVRYAVERMEETFPEDTLAPLERLMALARNRVRVLRSSPGLAWLLRSEQAYLTLPDEAVDALRALVKRSRKYLLDAIRQGAADGAIRDDIEPEVLLVPVMGTIHALAGMPGAHQFASRTHTAKREAVFAALEKMITPPESYRPPAKGERR